MITAVLLASACGGGGGGDSSENLVTEPPAAPQDGISGRAASKISGAQITVHDANGDEIVIASGRTTNENGAFNLVFSEFAINDGITAPLVLTLDGANATAVCDYDREGDNDCLTADGSFTAFGTLYDLPDGFVLKAVADSFPTRTDSATEDIRITVNLSAASDLAARYALDTAAGNPLESAGVTLAINQALGVVEFITGLSTNGRSLNEIAIEDLTLAQVTTTDRLAVGLFGTSLHGQVNTEDAGIANYRLVLNRMGNRIRPKTEGLQLTASGSFLSEVTRSYIDAANAFQSSLSAPSAVLAGAISSRSLAEPALAQAGGNAINIALPADPDSSDPLDQSKLFVASLSEAIGSTLLVSDTAAFPGTASGAAMVYQDQLSLLATLVSQETRNTILQLDQAITQALVDGETELTGTNVSGILESNDNVVTMTVATSTTSNIQTGIGVNITIPTGTRTNPGDTGLLESSDATISVSQTSNDLTTQELFEGTIRIQLDANDTQSLGFNGSLRAASGRLFSGDMTISNPAPLSEQQEQGQYQASFGFNDGSTLTMSGELASQINMTTVTSGPSTIVTDLVTNTITDMNTNLNLDVNQSGNVTGGTISLDDTTTGSMTAGGIISFVDDTSVSLPAPII